MILIMIRVIVLCGVVVDPVLPYQVILNYIRYIIKIMLYNYVIYITISRIIFQEVKADQIAEDQHLKSMSHRRQTLISRSLQF